MNARRIRAKSSYLSILDDGLLLSDKKNSLLIPNSFILKTNEQNFFDQKVNQQWTNIYLDPSFFKTKDILVKLARFKRSNKVFVYGKRSYGIHWDNVITRMYSRPQDLCFYCDAELNTKSKTKDHLVPVVVIRALGYNYIDDNTVPCCKDCNSEKASLMPDIFRMKAKRLIKADYKWKKVVSVLNKILINKKDPF